MNAALFGGGEGDIGDDEGPFAAFQFREEQLRVGNDAHAPAFGIENDAQGAGAWGVGVEDENTYLRCYARDRGSH